MDLDLRGVVARSVTHRGRPCVRLAESDPGALAGGMALLRGVAFDEGTLEAWVAGVPAPDAPPDMRGFVGFAFHVAPDAQRYDSIYLRPTNGRAEDQLRRNHACQYDARPEWPWSRLRDESPGVYEAYVDLEPDAWTQVRIEVEGARARLFVHGAAQPTLVVGRLLAGVPSGGVALWIGAGSVGHFADVKVAPRPRAGP